MKARKVTLIKRPVKLPGGETVRYWTSKWSDANGKDRYRSHGRVGVVLAEDAKQANRDLAQALGLGKVRVRHQKTTLAAFLEADRAAIKFESKPSTIVAHKGVSTHLITVFGGDTKLDEITEDHVARLKNWLSKPHVINGRRLSPCSKATVRKSIVTAKAMFNRAMDRDKPLVDRNPFRGKLTRVQSKQMRIFSREEIDALIEVAPTLWWQAFIKLAFTSGMRLGELLHTTWSDVDEATGYITVSAKRPGQFQAGGRSYPILPFSSKSHKPRRVPLHREAATLLRRLKMMSGGSIYPFLSLQRLAILAATEDVSEEILANRLVNNVLRKFRQLQRYARARLADQRGVDVDRVEWAIGSVHDLRRSFATHMAPHVSMVELQHLMGHANIGTTQMFYCQVSDDLGDKLKVAFG
ncbi:MAG: tyrosine-type recombinase/integrase [Phycisphaerales bacterium]